VKLLLIGGTRFLGRHLADAAMAAGHELTLLHRGRSNPKLFPQARHLIGDRGSDLALLTGGRWDAAIDTCAYVPRDVRLLAEALAGRVERYLLVSTISAYRDPGPDGVDEDSPLQELADPNTETVTGETYGGLKVLCERAAVAGFGAEATLVARPGLLVGPHDPTERFTWWLRRLHQGGEVVAPGPADLPVQWIDARDAADWLLRQAEAGTRGVFNLCGPVQPLTWRSLLEGLVQALQSDARLRWVDEHTLLQAGVAPWTGLPLWLPAAESGLHRVAIARAVACGLRTRDLQATARETLAWALSHPPAVASGTPGLDPALEQRLLAAAGPAA
jgi:2'-hydroxyisoflavone reductase